MKVSFLAFLLVLSCCLLWFWSREGKQHEEFQIPEETHNYLQLHPSVKRYIWGSSSHKKQTIDVRNTFEKSILHPNLQVEPISNAILIAIPSLASEFQHRHLVRTHQIYPYQHLNVTFKFFLPSLPFAFLEAVKFENETYGDIIVLEDSKAIGTNGEHFTSFKVFRHVERERNLMSFKYVAILDRNSFLYVPSFLNTYFNQPIQNLELSMIAHFIQGVGRFEWPKKGFVAVSWKLIKFLVEAYEKINPSVDEENFQMSFYLYDAELNYTKVHMDRLSAYDFRNLTDITPNSIVLYELKSEMNYLAAVSCFTSEGLNQTQVDRLRSFDSDL